jgi:uncharacterized protein (TIGR02246 family)
MVPTPAEAPKPRPFVRALLLITIAIAAAAVAVAALARAAAAPDGERLAATFAAAYNSRDAQRVAALYADDAELIPPDGTLVEGRAAIESAFREQLRVLRVVDVTSLHARFSGPIGFDAGRISISTQTADQGSDTVAGNYVAIYRLMGGHWKIAYHMFSTPLHPDFIG